MADPLPVDSAVQPFLYFLSTGREDQHSVAFR